jgi:hypothetical protein
MMTNQRFLKSMTKYLLTYFCAILLIGCQQRDELLFKNLSPTQSKVTFQNDVTESEDLNILDYLYFYNGGGVAIGDINEDGLPDIFFSGNQVKNKLYLNKGNLEFQDITDNAGVGGDSSWNTGAIMGDINGDGLLDIYVCAVVGINGFKGYNELYINNGDETFTESAQQYGLDFDTYSSTAALLDFDLDGDLDIYLLNHAVHTQESFGRVDLRYKRDRQTGDKLLRNDDGKFTDVSELAGIYGGPNGYGLGLAVADFNQDGYPDIYVGNDFHEDDYYYLNNGDGTFSESLREFFGHTSRFSMGNDIADINHDGYPDLISLDMLSEDEKVLKASDGDESFQIQKLRTEQYGYHYQYSRNMLYINQQQNNFMETALMSGVGATDWSWSALFADYNQDGEQDLFISNGIPKRPNNLDYIKFVSSDQIQNKISATKLVDQEALNLMPSGSVPNYIYKGGSDLIFENKSSTWIEQISTTSTATAMGDLDNDGDLDLVINNVNSAASILENTTNTSSSYLKLDFQLPIKNHFGIGTKVYAYSEGKLQYKELYTSRGFQASSQAILHFGFGDAKIVDSLKIVWPDQTTQTQYNVTTNQNITIVTDNNQPVSKKELKSNQIFTKVKNSGINFTHKEDNYLDFNRQKLIPYQISDRGPAIAVGDLNTDGKEDIFFGGSKFRPAQIFIQNDSVFNRVNYPPISNDSISEDVVAVISDFNNDKLNDLIIGSGGGDFYNEMDPLKDRYFVQTDSIFSKEMMPTYFGNTSVIRPFDYDNDGDLDVFIGSYAATNDFGGDETSYLLENDKGTFAIVETPIFENIGMLSDAVWDDFDNDGIKDLIVVGEWMSPKFFKNSNGILSEANPINRVLNGLWQRIQPFDIDSDGDIDYLLGNWGTNSKFKASSKYPLKMYYHDFDANGTTETIVCIEKDENYYPLLGLDVLAQQLVVLRKAFPKYEGFAGKTIEQMFDKKLLDNAKVLEVQELRSGYLKNEAGVFSFVAFQNEMQVAPIRAFLEYDFDADGKNEVLAAGNYFGIAPIQGRLDSFSGALIKSETETVLGPKLGIDFSNKAVKNLNIIHLKNKPYLLVTINNDSAEVYKIKIKP